MRCGVAIALAGAAALAACASPPSPDTAPPAGMAWSLSQVEGEGVKLAYGRPQSDDVLLMLTCEPGAHAVRVSALAGKAAPALTLTSGPITRRYPAESGPAGFGDGVVLESTLTPGDPVLARFAASGRLAVDIDGRRTALPAGDPAEARRFLASCH